MLLTLEVGTVGPSIFLGEASRDPCRGADPAVQMLNLINDVGNDLDAAASNSENGDLLALKDGALVIVCSMAKLSLKALKALDIGPIPSAVARPMLVPKECSRGLRDDLLENAAAIDEYVTSINE